jgi:hypothetical protein
MFKQTPGTLDVGHQVRTGGKVVDEWKFRSPFRDKGAPQLTATVSIDKSNSKEFTFVARSDSLPVAIVDTDINRLRERVDAALRQQHEILTGVVWEDWLEVEVRGRRRSDERGDASTTEADLKITYRRLKRGVLPAGEAYVVNSNGIAVPFPSAKRAGESDPDGGPDFGESLQGFRGLGRGRDLEAEYSYLPETPENVRALDDLLERMLVLRDNLSSFLRQDTVQKSLSDLASQSPALPAPL